MKLYVIVIGNKNKHRRYVSFNPFCNDNSSRLVDSVCLATFVEYKTARAARLKIMAEVMHKDVYIKRVDNIL